MDLLTSAFKSDFNTKLILKVNYTSTDTKIQNENEDYLKTLLKWLCTAPKVTSFRVNTLTHTTEEVYNKTKKFVSDFADKTNRPTPEIEKHALLTEVIIIRNWDLSEADLNRYQKEVIIDVHCAAAVLRGSQIFAPGIMAMLSGTRHGDKVSVYADVSKKCKKGLQKLYDDENKIFVANGIVKMIRYELFGENRIPRGIAVEVLENVSGCPPLQDFLPHDSALLQNLPSIVCSKVLNPTEGDTVLDMCASPGNKTTHICALMNNKGTVIAIDKTPAKVKQLRMTCEKFSANVKCFEADSTQIYDSSLETCNPVLSGPPFSKHSFDKILLDAPCSALGKRPQICNSISEKEMQSYVPLQRKLFRSAIYLLKPNGKLVYSTCTVTAAENEEIVSWALKSFPFLKLIKSNPHLGGAGLKYSSLSDEEQGCVQRFGPHQDIDSVGFFIACFVKTM